MPSNVCDDKQDIETKRNRGGHLRDMVLSLFLLKPAHSGSPTIFVGFIREKTSCLYSYCFPLYFLDLQFKGVTFRYYN
jgi:hypothetical protein